MTNSEIESRIGNCERLFDLKRARVEQLSEELRSLENSLDRQTFETRREGVRVQIRRAECLLGSAKREMSEATRGAARRLVYARYLAKQRREPCRCRQGKTPCVN